ncbi:hypothetical protein GGI07_004561 [Coemansia sp. Benny D115]|nr:hypothetical protein GGI07_004561 [Coemansia sp. Benny D115]
MRTFTIIALASGVACAQKIGFSGGSGISSGVNAINNPNINNGWQLDSSLFSSGNAAGSNIFNNVAGSQFSNINANAEIKDNGINNIGLTKIAGNSGWTANGDGNALGPIQNGIVGGGVPVFRRNGDVIISNGYHKDSPPSYIPTTPAYVPVAVPVTTSAPVVYHPAVSTDQPKYTPSSVSTSPPVSTSASNAYQVPVSEVSVAYSSPSVFFSATSPAFTPAPTPGYKKATY